MGLPQAVQLPGSRGRSGRGRGGGGLHQPGESRRVGGGGAVLWPRVTGRCAPVRGCALLYAACWFWCEGRIVVALMSVGSEMGLACRVSAAGEHRREAHVPRRPGPHRAGGAAARCRLQQASGAVRQASGRVGQASGRVGQGKGGQGYRSRRGGSWRKALQSCILQRSCGKCGVRWKAASRGGGAAAAGKGRACPGRSCGGRPRQARPAGCGRGRAGL
jgi:hypothetical protein